MVGRDFGGYQILRELGVGGMGVVYLAEHRLLGRRAAIKIIRAEIANDRSFSRRFLLEARAIAALNHPAIVRLYDFAFEEDTPYMVMEYVTGQTLEDVLAGGRKLEVSTLVELLQPVAAALDHAHKQGVVHRDVKPANVLLTDDGRTLIMDFGLASLVGFTMVADPEAVMGTPDYIAPEQIGGQPVDGRADVYSMAAVLFEAVTGDRPWRGRTWVEIARRRLTEPPPVAAGVSADLAAALVKGMARQPEQRTRTCAELLETLRVAATVAAEPAPAGNEVGATKPPAPARVALRDTIRARAVAAEAGEGGNGSAAAGNGAQAPGLASTEPRLGIVSAEPISAPHPPLAGTSRPAPEATTGDYPRVDPTQPRLPLVPLAAEPVAGRHLPTTSLIVVAGLTGLTLGVAWFTLLQEPLRGLIRVVAGH